MIYNGECGVFSPELLNRLKEAKTPGRIKFIN